MAKPILFKVLTPTLMAMAFGFGLTGCNGGKNQTNIEVIQGMMDQISLKAQDWDPLTGGGSSMRLPPEGTIPQKFAVYPYKGDPKRAAAENKNPIAGDFSATVLQTGKAHYQIYCGVCHGDSGRGDGTVSAKLNQKPASLLSEKAKAYTDGGLYHVIMDGFGLMGSYSTQIKDPKTRWAVVNYVRNLQKSQ